jgi:glutathione peroxidase-family protein
MKTSSVFAALAAVCASFAWADTPRDVAPDYAKKPDIKWNFTKFLIGRDGRIIRRFEPTAPLSDVEEAVCAALK